MDDSRFNETREDITFIRTQLRTLMDEANSVDAPFSVLQYIASAGRQLDEARTCLQEYIADSEHRGAS